MFFFCFLASLLISIKYNVTLVPSKEVSRQRAESPPWLAVSCGLRACRFALTRALSWEQPGQRTGVITKKILDLAF